MPLSSPQTPKVVVSMTSFPAAVPYAEQAIRSLLAGTVLPDKLVLYLTLSQFDQIPESLKELEKENPVFEIRDYPRDIRSYRKLIPALIDFPESIIVTVDDDVYYHRKMLEELLQLHEKCPNAVLAHRAKRIALHKPYREWKKYRWYDFLFKKIYNNILNMQTGVGGVLYPPHSLHRNVLDVEMFTKLAPTNDDIWFWGAGVAQGFSVVPVPFGRNKPRGIGKPQDLSLKWVNFKRGTNRNLVAFRAVVDHFPGLREKINAQG